ncbi:myb-like protein D [Teleopsis dalmanni]|uniref:myb-like protein D n=1 Tax=Teleopsis dalmanni TaxID=139649 RepID=UPI0018CDADE5|nr:myb-like protein D [Teleopsis dalmanni]
MVCYLCPTTSKSEYDCIQTSVENIIKHCSYLNQEHQKQCKEIHLLKERNKQLNDVVTMMQRQKTTQSCSQDFISAKRRRKQSINENTFAIDSSSSDTSFNDELPQTSKLNVALDSEELLECSELNATVDDENIAETENVIKRKDSLLTAIRKNISVNSLRETNTNNSTKTVVNMNKNNNNINKADWLAKGASHQKITHFIAPLPSENAQLTKKDNDKKINLSLNKKNIHKFKQTRLQLDGPHEHSYDKVGKLVNNDVIINSPLANSSLKQSKASRSWLLRVSNNSKENVERSAEKNLHVSDHMANNDTKRDNHASQIEFDISNNDITKSDELLADILAEELNEEKTSEKSVLVLTPATQDIIFLDDTDIDSDIIVNHKERASLKNSCEHERDNLIAKSTVSNINIKKEMSSQDNTNILDETYVKELEEIENVKEENRSIFTDKIKNKLPDAKYTDDSEDFMVLPIMVKEEECSEELLHKKQSIKERFKIDCQDCLKYIAFLGDNLSDREIMSHIRQCSRHKEDELLRWNTPDGFWDPFIRSFNENDPRKEVLIDTRFANKRGGK